MKTIRIFISSPGDVARERERAREVVESLRRRYSRHFMLEPVLWEDLPLQSDASFQQGIDAVLSEKGADIAIFILWSRLGSSLGHAIPKPDGTPYNSGTEREYDLFTQARATALAVEGVARPQMLVYTRKDDASFDEALRGTSTQEKEELIRQKKLVEQFLSETFKDQDTGHNIGAYFPFDRPTTFSQRLRTHLQSLLDQMAGEATEVIWDIEKQGPPFLGLEAFQLQHAPVFFGREEEILEARRALKEQARDGCAFLLLSGASGSGKSSLARAGVLPTITELEVDEQVAGWRSLVITPSELGSDPITALVARLAATDLLDSPSASAASLTDLAAGLKKDPELTFSLRLKDAFAQAAARHDGAVRLLLVLDQLEELFNSSTLATADRTAFLAVVETFARSGSVWVLATVRSDFYQQVQLEPALVRMKSGHGQLDVLPPGPDALQRLIEEPARLAGLTFENRGDQSLSSRIIRDAATHAELLPLVEFVLRELYEQRNPTRQLTFAAYEALGGVEGALAKRADETHAALPGDAQESLSIVLQALVTLDNDASGGGGEKIVRQRARLADFDTKPAAKALVDAFIAARLFTTCQIKATGDPAVTVAHESLLRVWPRARAWAEQNKDFLQTRARLTDRMVEGSPLLKGDPLTDAAKLVVQTNGNGFSFELTQWLDQQFAAAEVKERRAARIRRTVTTILSALTVISLLASIWAYIRQNEAKIQTLKAQRSEQLARDSERLANHEMQNAETAKKQQNQLLWQASMGDHEAAIRAFSENKSSEGLAYLYRALQLAPQNRVPALLALSKIIGDDSCRIRTRSARSFKGYVRSLAFSPDGKCFVAGIWGGTQVIESATANQISHMNSGGGYAHSVAFSPNGKYYLVGSGDKTARVIEAASGKEVSSTLFEDEVNSVAFSPDGKSFVAGGECGTARVMETTSGKETSRSEFEGPVNSVAFSPDGNSFIAGSDDDTARMIEVASGKEVLRTAFKDEVNSVAFSPDGRSFVAGSDDHTARVIEVVTGKEISRSKFEGSVNSVAFSPDGRFFVAGSDDHTARVIEVVTGKEISRSKFEGSVYSVAFSPDGRFFIAGSDDHTARVIEAVSGEEISRLGFTEEVQSVAFSPDGRYLVAGSDDQSARVLEMASVNRISRSVVGSDVKSVAFSPNGNYYVAASWQTARVIEVLSGNEISRAFFESSYVTSVACSPDGSQFVAGIDDETACVIEAATGKEISRMKFEGTVNSVAFSPDGKHIVAVGTGFGRGARRLNFARVMEAASGKEVSYALLDDLVNDVNFVVFSRDGQCFVVGSFATARVIDTASGKEISTMKFEDDVESVAFIPDGRCLVAVSYDKVVRVIEPATGKELSRMKFENSVYSVAFSSDGEHFLVGTSDGSCRLIETASSKEISRMKFEGAVNSVAFSPDGKSYVAGCSDEMARVILLDYISYDDSDHEILMNELLLRGGQKFDKNGVLRFLTSRELAVESSNINQLKNGMFQGELHRWLIAESDKRSFSPWNNELLSRYAGGRLMSLSESTELIGNIVNIAPWHPLVPLAWAPNEVSNYFYRRSLARLCLKRILDADENLYGNNDLADYCATASQWALTWKCIEEARSTAEEGLRRVPNHTGCLNAKEACKRFDDISNYVESYFQNTPKKTTATLRNEGVLWHSRAEFFQQSGDLKTAREALEKFLAISQRLAQVDPRNAEAQRDLSVCYNNLGWIAQAEGDLKAAREAFEKGLEIRLGIAQADPSNAQALRDLAYCYRCLADLFDSQKAYKQAIDYTLNRIQALEKCPDSSKELSAAYNALSWRNLFARNFSVAGDASRKALALETAPIFYSNLAHAHLFQGQFTEAEKIYTSHKGEEMDSHTWEYWVADDFRQFREVGLDHPDMKRIEKLLGIE